MGERGEPCGVLCKRSKGSEVNELNERVAVWQRRKEAVQAMRRGEKLKS
jgi:hypothetical protein